MMDSEGNVGTAVTSKVKEHADNTGTVDKSRGRRAVRVFRERRRLGGGVNWIGVFLADAASFNDLLGEARLGQGGLGPGTLDVDTKEAFGCTFTAQLEIVVLEV